MLTLADVFAQFASSVVVKSGASTIQAAARNVVVGDTTVARLSITGSSSEGTPSFSLTLDVPAS